MATQKIQLMIIKADGDIQDASFEQDSVIVGSGASANVQLDDDKVSSIHAMIKVDPEKGIRVIDLGSESGTRIGGKEIREESIESGDVVEVGGCKIRVSFGDGAEAGREMTEVVSVPDDAAGEPTEEETVEQEALPAKKAGKKKSKDKKKDKKAAAAPPPAPEAAPKSKNAPQSTEIVQALQPEGDAMKLFSEEIPESERPGSGAKLLEVVMVWSDTIIGLGHFDSSRKQVTVGDGKKNDFNLANDRIPLHRFPFLQAEGDSWQLVLAEGMDLRVRDGDGETVALEELKERGRVQRADTEFKGYTYKLALRDQAMIFVDDTVFVIRYVKPSKRIVTNAWATLDFYFTKVLSTSLMAHILFFAALLFTPINTEELSEDLFKNPNRFAKLIIRPPEKDKKKFKDLSGIDEGKKAKDDEGKFGKKEEIKKEADPSKKGAPVVDVDKREEDRKKVMKSGLLAALDSSDSASSNILGPGGLGTGINNALGGLQGGAGMGDAHGVGGLGSRGTGPGGGGSALGIGGLGTKGGGRGRGGYGSVDLGGKGRGKSKLTSGTTIVRGGLDKEVIARIVRRHQNEIKYCYERELQKDPNLYGKVAILWIIDATGAVAKATVAQTTMGNSNVENCIITRVKRWRFPQPKGGGIVQVTYPWIFKPSN